MANEALARAWIDDLKSGNFEYAQSCLVSDKGCGPLGVLSLRIADDPAVKKTGWSFDGRTWRKGKETNSWTVPWDVWAAVGFDSGVPSAGYIARRCDTYGESFATIAQHIELALGGARVVEMPAAFRD